MYYKYSMFYSIFNNIYFNKRVYVCSPIRGNPTRLSHLPITSLHLELLYIQKSLADRTYPALVYILHTT